MKKHWAKDLAKSIRSQRKRLGLTQQELADKSRCGIAYMYLIENGKPSLRLDKLLDVLTALGLQLKLEHGTEGVVVEAEERSRTVKPDQRVKTPRKEAEPVHYNTTESDLGSDPLDFID